MTGQKYGRYEASHGQDLLRQVSCFASHSAAAAVFGTIIREAHDLTRGVRGGRKSMFACRSVGAMQVSFGWQPLLTQETGMQVRMGKCIDVALGP